MVRVQVEVGDIVSIKMDPREATKAQALHGVVFERVEDAAGGCQVVTVHGVVSKDSYRKTTCTSCHVTGKKF